MRILRAGIVVGVALLVSACFDIEQTVKIDNSGAGTVSLFMTSDRLVGEDMAFESILKSADGEPDIRKYIKDGQFHYEETLGFKSINTLSLKDETMSVDVGERSFWGFGPASATFRRTLNLGGAKSALPPIIGSVFKENTYTFTVALPGWIQDAEPVVIGGQEIAPEFKNGSVTWSIPLDLFMSADRVTFEASFSGFFKMGQVDGSQPPQPPGTDQ